MRTARMPADMPAKAGAGELTDLRFHALIGAEAWAGLPSSVRHRFSHRLLPGGSLTYRGEIAECRMSRSGWLLAQLCRLIGAPLPLGRDTGLAAVVTVTEDGATGGQVWSRIYARRRAFPQVIHSAKRFSGPTGLEEYLGCGFGIALAVGPLPAGICFRSDHYFLRLGSARMRLPAWMSPGALRIDHVDSGDGGFDFILRLRHRLLGEMIHQIGHFRDQPMDAAEKA
jgi:hypothetical protein